MCVFVCVCEKKKKSKTEAAKYISASNLLTPIKFWDEKMQNNTELNF